MNAVVLQDTVQTGVIGVAGWAVLIASLALALGWALHVVADRSPSGPRTRD